MGGRKRRWESDDLQHFVEYVSELILHQNMTLRDAVKSFSDENERTFAGCIQCWNSRIKSALEGSELLEIIKSNKGGRVMTIKTTNVTVVNSGLCINYTFDVPLDEFKTDYNEQISKRGFFTSAAIDGKRVTIYPKDSMRVDIENGLF